MCINILFQYYVCTELRLLNDITLYLYRYCAYVLFVLSTRVCDAYVIMYDSALVFVLYTLYANTTCCSYSAHRNNFDIILLALGSRTMLDDGIR